ncbi:anti-sigma factor domain-containing protein [Bacillus sp. NTK074B]|uniref:anti-sigma factor domain-containing protein n=1 Tax=Bacillus sp. NTK074B TaxID=2802174 RepID=UPI001A8C2F66|nr:anti-sigma factor domain-containing protein [Bacillus sp. NTK074B]
MKKGIIMEIKQDILVMMTPEGEFLNGKRHPDQQYSIGEEIPFFPAQKKSINSKPFFKWDWRISTSLITALVFIIALFSSAVILDNRAYAYVSVDINPSMELTLNKQQKVIEIKPFNDDAQLLLRKLSKWEDEDVGKVTEMIFQLSEKLGYLKDHQNVIITSSFLHDTDHKKGSELLDELNEFVEDYSSDHQTNIIVKETSEEFREKASEKGMTAGSLLREEEQINNKYENETETETEVETETEIEKQKEKPVIKERNKKPDTFHEEEKPKEKNQKEIPPIKEQKQNKGKPKNLPDDQYNRENPRRERNEEKKKPDHPSQSKSSHSDNRNRGHDQSSNRVSIESKQKHDQNEDHPTRKKEKKDEHKDRKENKKN